MILLVFCQMKAIALETSHILLLGFHMNWLLGFERITVFFFRTFLFLYACERVLIPFDFSGLSSFTTRIYFF